MIRRHPRTTQGVSSAASDVYKRQEYMGAGAQQSYPRRNSPGRSYPPSHTNKASPSPGLDSKEQKESKPEEKPLHDEDDMYESRGILVKDSMIKSNVEESKDVHNKEEELSLIHI
eukprot:TRINITY_DN47099_c0_g2_i1.p1 TRINITY_DN47099_c0_g2~~TRINITY_DN47099_c0_g2_i1.p1  ORF type:complete len:115 (+),score=26.85 TRINITY_DN47099_c0_g2_i1:30-374(+)